MSRPVGKKTDTEPLELWEYTRVIECFDVRWRLFYEILWETGVRVGEALSITKDDLTNAGVWITREKRKDHPRDFCPLTVNLISRLQANSLLTRGKWLFPSPNSAREHCSNQAAWDALKKAVKAAGVRKAIHPHSFRHGLGFRARKAGYDIAVVQRLLGHKDMSSTEHYFKATEREVQDTLRKLNNPGI